MKRTLRTICAALLFVPVLAGCSSENDNEPALGERYIKVEVQESLLPKGDESYKPKAYAQATTMLFTVPASTLATEQSRLAEGIAVQQGGKEVKAAYTSNAGYLAGVEFGTYTLLVYCHSNLLNGYLSGRYTYKPLVYGASNYQLTEQCLFVWEDMNMNGGYYEWQIP